MSRPSVAPMPTPIARDEFRDRQRRAAAMAEERGLQGIVVWGRGGGTQDRYADLYYLTNYYSQYPLVSDRPPGWSARGHGALVLPAKGRSRLIVDMPIFRDDLAVADDIVLTDDVVGAVAGIVAKDVPTGAVGVLGNEALAWRWRDELVAAVGPRLVDADALGAELRLIKSDAELAILRAAGHLGALAVKAILDASVPGATEADVAAAGIEVIVRGGGAFYGMGLSSGDHAGAYGHSQPAAYDGRSTLAEGEMLRVDIYGSLDGYLFDLGRSCVVGGEPTPEQEAMLDAAQSSVRAGIAKAGPGVPVAEVARACHETFAASEYARRGPSAPLTSFPWGHGVGLAWEGPWIEMGSDAAVEPSTCLCVERRLARAGIGGVTYEDDFIVTENGCEVITVCDEE